MFPTVIKSLYEEPLSIQNLIMEMWDFLWAYTFLQNYLPFFLACKHFPIAPETPINKFIKLVLSRKKKRQFISYICASKHLCMVTHTHTLVFVFSLLIFCILESKFMWWVWWCKFGGSEIDTLLWLKKGKKGKSTVKVVEGGLGRRNNWR